MTNDPNRDFPLMEWSILDLQNAMIDDRYSSKKITQLYLDRIDSINLKGPTIRAVIEVNPYAVETAEQLDQERAAGQSRGPLHGIPILLKDNVDTGPDLGMQTTAGSLALEGTAAPRDAFITQKLREAGAVILGKANLSEWANFRSSRSSSGWSGRGGQAKNPYALNRSCSGSSSGSGAAVAANLCAAAIGTETDGSIVSPSSANGIVGIKPTVGMVSRSGIIPIAASQDTAGPMARTVADAAILLQAVLGTDVEDQSTINSPAFAFDYTKLLKSDGLSGIRVGVLSQFLDKHHPKVVSVFSQALDTMRSLGATIIEDVQLPTKGKWHDAELKVLLYEYKAGLKAYFESRGPAFKPASIADVIAFNQAHAERSMPIFGQELMLMAEETPGLDDQVYLDARAECLRLTREEGLDAALSNVDVLVAPTRGPVWQIDHINGDSPGPGTSSPCAVSGYPHVTVPLGFVNELPFNLSFMGRAWEDAKLIRYAYAFEQATQVRQPPKFLDHVQFIT